jgi:type IV secretion system protein VirB2
MSTYRRSFFVLVLLLIFADTVFGAGFAKAEELLEKVQTGLAGLSIFTVTIAIIWVGYKVLFGGQTLRECTPIIIGAILIAASSEVARLLVGSST